ncbi:MAG: tyrosine-type recombinase/integrase [Verrucomicrobia bacterium]|nr:tyrosine-type recombinase/integrase [Verrucomicrobiota bacterium]MBU1910193.1 tyrosine-type recombinase/integrase [Verrucomicrobiota bacterium]
MTKRVSAHTFRHSLATHLLQDNYSIRVVQERLGPSLGRLIQAAMTSRTT